ncbi:MAG: hypothetical protein A2X47_14075 [Lentisphaerae bacterium GWF2_38_69]|nr:MAG: hypothetical protein A2X47_14075 [Lentisphaerae bacterium GWF2_38_69]
MKLLLKTALYNNASDLLLTAGAKPSLRINGSIKYLESGILGSIDTKRLLFSILSRNQRAMFEENKEIDLALSLHIESKRFGNRKNSRFRVNGFYQKGNIAAAIRLVSERIPTPEELHLPKALVNIINRTSGLILVTGPTGHGKSTTLASLINQINQTRSAHIISIEDPIEYVHVNKEAIIEQREIYSDTKSYANGLKYILRQNPDIIMIGEMRDPETIAIALTAAELGHLVLSTLHTGSSYSSINRIIDSFPSEQQNQIRNQLAGSLLCVTSQRLLPSADNSFRVAAFEVLLGTTAIKALIREAKIHLIPTTIETGAKDGMITMDMALNDLYKKNLISKESMANILTDIDYTQKKS